MPIPVRIAAWHVRTAAPGYFRDPAIIPRTPREYLSSSNEGVTMYWRASLAVQIFHFSAAMIVYEVYLFLFDKARVRMPE